MSDPFAWIPGEIAELDRQQLRRWRRLRQSPQDAHLRLDETELINFGSNDYLGLARELGQSAALRSLSSWGSGASPLISGRGRPQADLEFALAQFEHTEAALLFSSGYAANLGTLAALAGRSDVICSDAKNHASIVDGCRLSGASVRVYPHADVNALRTALASSNGFRRRLIVTDSLFSMDGDLAPLPALVDLAEEFGAMLVVDEAHATGVFGAGGRGVVEHFGLEERIQVRVGTLSKALGSSGGFTVGPAPVIEWLVHKARSYFFSTAMPDACALIGQRALEIVTHEPERRVALRGTADRVRTELRHMGWSTGASHSQIIPVLLGDPGAALYAADWLWQAGLFVPAIRPPSVPAGESLLRISLSYAHSPADIGQLLEALAELRGLLPADVGSPPRPI